MKENSNFLEIMSRVQEGDKIINQLGTVFTVWPNKTLKCTECKDGTIFSLHKYGFLSPIYIWSIVPKLKKWNICDRIAEIIGNGNYRYYVGIDPNNVNDRCLFIAIRFWGENISYRPSDTYTCFSATWYFDSLVTSFIDKIRPSGNYEHNPEDFQELYELVKKVAS